MKDIKFDLEELVEYFYKQLEECQISPKQLYALSNVLLREVASSETHFYSFTHFHQFESEYNRISLKD